MSFLAYYDWMTMEVLAVAAAPIAARAGDVFVEVPDEDVLPIHRGVGLTHWAVEVDKAQPARGRLRPRLVEIMLRYVEDGLYEVPGEAEDPDVVLEHDGSTMAVSVGQRLYDLANKGSQLAITGLPYIGFYATRRGDPTIMIRAFRMRAERLFRRGRLEFPFETEMDYSVFTNRVFDGYILRRHRA